MVVTATRTEEPLKEIPGRVEVITREQLKEMPVQTVDEALSYISGVHQERSSGLDSFKSVVSLRGMGNVQGRTLVMRTSPQSLAQELSRKILRPMVMPAWPLSGCAW